MLSCPHRPPCSGCPRLGEPGIAPDSLGALNRLARGAGLSDVEVVCGAPIGFRHRARLAVRGRLGAPRIGLFEADSHRLVHVPQCLVHHPLINHVASVVRRALVDARVSCYSESAHAGIVRYLQVVVERASQSAQVVLVGNCDDAQPLEGVLALLRERLGAQLHSLWFNAQTDRSNVILGREFTRVCGPASVVERFGGAAIHYPPGAFGQNNLEIAERIVQQVAAAVPPGSTVTEYYAGVGAIGLSILDRVARIALNELAGPSLQGLELGLAQLGAADRAKVQVLPGAAGQACMQAQDADVVIVDPPRKGLDAALARQLALHPPRRLIYVSCGLLSLQRDLALLTASGRVHLTGVRAFNLMPYTEHVETLVTLDRV